MAISGVPVWPDVALERFGTRTHRRSIGAMWLLNEAFAATMRRYPWFPETAARVKEGLSWLLTTLAFVTIVYAIILLPGLMGG